MTGEATNGSFFFSQIILIYDKAARFLFLNLAFRIFGEFFLLVESLRGAGGKGNITSGTGPEANR